MITVNKTYLIAGILLLISLIVTSLGIYGFFKYQSSNRIACTSIASKAVLGQTTRPAQPDLVKNEGGGISIDPISVIVNDNTFPYDIYLYSKEIAKTNPAQIQGMWQVTDSYQIYFKSFFNDAIVTDPGQEFILNIRYDEIKLKTDQ